MDHAAATPLDPQVKKSMDPFFVAQFGNPSSLYGLGKRAALEVKNSRLNIAKIIGSRPQEIIFTAGGTESTNLAIFGVARNMGKGHIITSSIEHHAVLNPIKALEQEGYSATYLPVDAQGFINLSELKKAVRPDTILISIIYANNEIGTVQHLGRIGKLVSGVNSERGRQGLAPVLFHSDACQAAGALDMNVNRLGVDLLSVNGSKIYGPKQAGFLYAKTGVKLRPLVYGGGQENNMRSGTENVAGVVGLAKALEISQKNLTKENKRQTALRNFFIAKLLKIKGTKLNGPDPKLERANGIVRLPNNINISFKGVEGEALMLYLDAYGVCVSTGSACATGSAEPSHVLLSLGATQNEAQSSIRFTLGRSTTKKQLEYVLKILPGILAELRRVDNFLFQPNVK